MLLLTSQYEYKYTYTGESQYRPHRVTRVDPRTRTPVRGTAIHTRTPVNGTDY